MVSVNRIIECFFMPVYDRLLAIQKIAKPGAESRLIAQTVKMRTYVSDGIVSSHFADKWLRDLKNYDAAWDLVDHSYSSTHKSLMRQRAYFTCKLIGLAIRAPGDFLELGVHWGILPKHYLLEYASTLSDRQIWLFDLWGDKQEFDARPDLPKGSGSYLSDNFELVRKRFQGEKNVKFVRGYVPETLSIVSGREIAYLSLDLNSWKPEIQALEILWTSISSGGVVFFDDIGGITYSKQREVVEDFLSSKSESLIYLPTGQAFLIKS
jgi:O-methyltransferase